jgi:hypothetical protein
MPFFITAEFFITYHFILLERGESWGSPCSQHYFELRVQQMVRPENGGLDLIASKVLYNKGGIGRKITR